MIYNSNCTKPRIKHTPFTLFCSNIVWLCEQYDLIDNNNHEYKIRNIIQLFEFCIHNIRNNIFDNDIPPYDGIRVASMFVKKSTQFISEIKHHNNWTFYVSYDSTYKLLEVSQTLCDLSISIIQKYIRTKYNYNNDTINYAIKQAKLLYSKYIRIIKGLRSSNYSPI